MKVLKKSIIKVGDSYYYPIPKSFVDNQIISLNKKYNADLEEC